MTVHSLEPLRPWKAEQLGGGYAVSSWCERVAVESAAAVIAVSDGMRDDVLAAYPAVRPDRVRVIHNGIDTAEYSPDPGTDVLDALRRRPGAALVVFVGRVTRQKGVPVLLAGRGRLDPAAQLVLCAGQADTPELEAEVSEPGRSCGPSGPGWSGSRDAGQARGDPVAAHATVFACPSLYEPLGIVNLEAMACGTAVVGSAGRRHPRGGSGREDRPAGSARGPGRARRRDQRAGHGPVPGRRHGPAGARARRGRVWLGGHRRADRGPVRRARRERGVTAPPPSAQGPSPPRPSLARPSLQGRPLRARVPSRPSPPGSSPPGSSPPRPVPPGPVTPGDHLSGWSRRAGRFELRYVSIRLEREHDGTERRTRATPQRTRAAPWRPGATGRQRRTTRWRPHTPSPVSLGPGPRQRNPRVRPGPGRVAQRLQQAFAERRLDDDEFDERMRAALTARTSADLES